MENTIIEPKFNGIDVIGDSPILRRNQVLRPRARALHVQDFQHPSGRKVSSKPFLDDNTFGAPEPAVAAGNPTPAQTAGERQMKSGDETLLLPTPTWQRSAHASAGRHLAADDLQRSCSRSSCRGS